MADKQRFETKLGLLECSVEAKDEYVVFLSFECYETGKVFEVEMQQKELEGLNKLFAYDVTFVDDVLKKRPEIAFSRKKESVVVTYTVSVMGRENKIQFVILPKKYPEGSNEEVFELKRQLRLQARQIETLTTQLHKARVAQSSRQIVYCPEDKLLVTNAEAHRIMMAGDYEYIGDKYRTLTESKQNTSIDIVTEFLKDDHDRYLFNLHFLNRSQGWQFICCAMPYVGSDFQRLRHLEAIKTNLRCSYDLRDGKLVPKPNAREVYLDRIQIKIFNVFNSRRPDPPQILKGLQYIVLPGHSSDYRTYFLLIVQKQTPRRGDESPPPYPA